ncbi:MAG: hypothetical protein KGP01_00545 [Actinomycetales bacterium]|nr:hypothetical protein [Actinomycetales bacterium]
MARGAWRPLAGGQEGLLARRRRRRVVSVLVVAALVNVAVWLLTADLRAALTCAALTVVATPVLGRLMFSRR